MPSLLHFSEEKDLLLALAQSIGQRLRPEFLPPSAKSSRPCGQARQPRRFARTIPPELPNASPRFRSA
jgi:hypothetical protein